jgi:succinyl-CoA synthetase beta subunit
LKAELASEPVSMRPSASRASLGPSEAGTTTVPSSRSTDALAALRRRISVVTSAGRPQAVDEAIRPSESTTRRIVTAYVVASLPHHVGGRVKIHEYQGKQLFAKYGVAVPKGYPAFTVDEAEAAAKRLISETGSQVVVVKAQIHAGGRGKGGGVKVAKGGASDAKELASKILGMQLVTHQTGSEGQRVRRLYIEQGLDMAQEYYLGAVVDRDRRRVAFMASTEGGVEIEKVAAETPDKILTIHVDPVTGLMPFQSRELAFGLGLMKYGKETVAKFVRLMGALYRMLLEEDCSLVEVNPLAVLKTGDVVALDAKINFDDNAEFRHKTWAELQDKDEEDPVELEAKEAGLNYV